MALTPGVVKCVQEQRSNQGLIKRTLRGVEFRIKDFLIHAPRFRVDTTLEALQARGKNKPTDLERLQEVCDNILDKQSPQAFSAQWVDSNGEVLFSYMAHRWKPSEVCFQKTFFLCVSSEISLHFCQNEIALAKEKGYTPKVRSRSPAILFEPANTFS
jgi:hypothetical protein